MSKRARDIKSKQREKKRYFIWRPYSSLENITWINPVIERKAQILSLAQLKLDWSISNEKD